MFSKSTEYALRAVLFIGKFSSSEKKLSITEIAHAIKSPKSFTAKILQKLTKKNTLITSVSGPNGGLYISEQAKKTSMMKVLFLLEEDHVINKCVLGLHECSEVHPCPMHHRYKLIKPLLLDMFENKTIQDILVEMSNKPDQFKAVKEIWRNK